MKVSSELDDSERSEGFDEGHSPYDDRPGNGKGIKSSWRGEKSVTSARPFPIEPVEEIAEHGQGSQISPSSSKVRGHLVDVGLEDSLRADAEEDQAPPSPSGRDPPIQRFRERGSTRDLSGISPLGPTEQAGLLSQDVPRPSPSPPAPR